MPPTPEILAELLRARLGCDCAVLGEAGYDAARSAYNLAVDQRPAAVVLAASAADVASAVRVAAEQGLRVAAQGTGHGCGALASLADAILVRTDRLGGIEIDAAGRRARVGAGATWGEIAAAADAHGLAGLAGTAATVRVAGYATGGGIGWLARRHGLASESIRAVELVTADGEQVRADAAHEPDLLWAIGGGGGSFGIVTALELELVPVPDLYAGALFWPLERAAEVLHAWRAWTGGLPDEVTSLGRLLRLPPIPEIPEPFRGRSFVVLEAAFLGPADEGAALLAPLRSLGPELDTIRPMRPTDLPELNMDPPEPVPYAGDGLLIADFPAAAVDALLDLAGPGRASPLLSIEVRHLGGALGRRAPGCGALGALAGGFAVFGVGMGPTQEAIEAIEGGLDALHAALAPWDEGRRYLNFTERRVDPACFYEPADYRRLRELRGRVDPAGRLLANHPIPPL
ncbi:MAG: FAD-binding oxidoreductase [Thermoleophilia bacterium]